MPDLIAQLCQLTAEILQANPQADVARLVGLVKQGIYADSYLGTAIQGDRQLVQINQGNARGFQTLVTGGVANIGIHLNDVDQETLQAVLQEALGELLKSLPKLIPSNVRQGSKNFVEREGDILADIHEKLQIGQGVIVCAVEGMGGVGKTELALQYAARYQQEYVGRYWLSLREMGLAQAVVILASAYIALPEPMQSKSLEEQAEWYWKNWLPESGKLLVILDDVPSAESLPDLAMPLDPRVQILVTTRERDLNLGFESLAVQVLSEEKAIELLRKIVGVARVEKELATVKEICKTLGYLPLGLELVGEYLVKNRHLNFAKLQERLTLADESLSRDRSNKFYGYRGVVAAMQLSWDDLSKGSQRVAMWLGLFAPVEILWELVADLGKNVELTEAELDGARGELDRLHLIAPTDEGCDFYTIHSLVRGFMQMKLSEATENQQFRQGFVMGLLEIAKQMPQSPTLDKIAEMTPVIPHLDLLSREMLDDISNPEEDENLVWAFTGIARYYEGQGLYTLAEDPWQRRLTTVKEKLGDRHPDVAASLNCLAELYRNQGKYSEAEPLYQESLQLRQELFGDSHPSVSTSLNNLALLYQSQGRYGEAEPLYHQALYQALFLLGDRHPFVATNLNNLAVLYHTQGKYEAAEPLYRQALFLRQELLGDRHPYVAQSLDNLAALYQSQGRYEAAEPLFRQALSVSQELLGDRHPDVATNLSNLAELYRVQGKYEAAEPLFQQALSLWQELLGDRHPAVATSLNNLALLYQSQGRYEAAESFLLQALSLRQELLGDRHPDVAQSLNNLAALYHSQGVYEAVEPLYRQALFLRQELLGDRHPDVAQSLNNLAFLYNSQGRYAEAELLYQQALEILMSTVGENHPDTENVMSALMMLKLKAMTGLDAATLEQMAQTNPEALRQLIQQIMSN